MWMFWIEQLEGVGIDPFSAEHWMIRDVRYMSRVLMPRTMLQFLDHHPGYMNSHCKDTTILRIPLLTKRMFLHKAAFRYVYDMSFHWYSGIFPWPQYQRSKHWCICLKISSETTENSQYNNNKTKHDKIVCIFRGTCSTLFLAQQSHRKSIYNSFISANRITCHHISISQLYVQKPALKL